MHFKQKLKKFLEDHTGIRWEELDHKKIYIALAVLAAVIALVIILGVTAGSGKKDTKETEQLNTENVTETENTDSEEALTEEEDDSLKVDAYEEVNALIERYFTGLASGDLEQVASAVDVLSEEEKLTIDKKKDYIESYDQITCYTKKGLEENSYVVFAAYEMKIYNIETPAPGIMALYVCTAEDGNMYIFNGEASDELKDYVLQLAAEEEVAAVIADVDARYQQLVAENEDLGKFADTMLQSQEEVTDLEPVEPVDETASSETELEHPIDTIVTETVRVREERSTDSAILDTLAAGTGVKVYANYEDGWSKIEYNGTAGYCKTEFLQDTEAAPETEEEPQPEDSEAQETQTEENEPNDENSDVTAVNKQMQFKDTVTVRAERSADSDRLTTGYALELPMVIESYSDGWSKIEYNGITGYCKTEFLREPQ